MPGTKRRRAGRIAGTILYLCGEQFKALAGGLNIAHVPYRG
jgi:hypothetical protein